jgi:hypothetical protein
MGIKEMNCWIKDMKFNTIIREDVCLKSISILLLWIQIMD